jgi:hypothetical protein
VQQGLKAGQEVIIEGVGTLKENTKIRPKVVKSAKTEMAG